MTTPTPQRGLTDSGRQQQRLWSQGDYAAVATQLVVVSENLCEAIDLRAGSNVLDVACGSGNTAIAAARRNCTVTGIDVVPQLLERARERAVAERLPIRFDLGDAAQLPYPDGSFDVVLSTFGAMFPPEQEKVAAELLRVCRSGGTIGLANWTPDGWSGISGRIRMSFLPPPEGARSPLRWGTEEGLREIFGDEVASIRVSRRSFVFRYRSPAHWLEFNLRNFGPVVSAFAALDEDRQEEFANELLQAMVEANVATDGTLVVPSGYLEVVVRRA